MGEAYHSFTLFQQVVCWLVKQPPLLLVQGYLIRAFLSIAQELGLAVR